MVICHYDRRGERWLLRYDCTRAQAFLLACFLRALRNTRPRARHRRSGRTTTTEAANERFCADLEQEVLNDLYNRHPATEDDFQRNELFVL